MGSKNKCNHIELHLLTFPLVIPLRLPPTSYLFNFLSILLPLHSIASLFSTLHPPSSSLSPRLNHKIPHLFPDRCSFFTFPNTITFHFLLCADFSFLIYHNFPTPPREKAITRRYNDMHLKERTDDINNITTRNLGLKLHSLPVFLSPKILNPEKLYVINRT